MNILLVDDNTYILQGLQAGIDYTGLGDHLGFHSQKY